MERKKSKNNSRFFYFLDNIIHFRHRVLFLQIYISYMVNGLKYDIQWNKSERGHMSSLKPIDQNHDNLKNKLFFFQYFWMFKQVQTLAGPQLYGCIGSSVQKINR